MKSTNYYTTFIRVAEDSAAQSAVVPPPRGAKKPIHLLHYELIAQAPYTHTQDDVLWLTHVMHKELTAADATPAHREEFFAKGQPCLRTSALAKKYGWGFHFDEQGRVALVPLGSTDYERLVADSSVRQLKAMRSSRRG
ncbi:MAG: hypothetical protein KDD78_07330 [Caldilineaceae bacterium]|nr:hypothetical protein [Caldilineaceae bacterium]